MIDTKTQDFTDFAQRADAVIDTVGGKTQDQLFTLAKPSGIVVSAVVPPNELLASQYGVRSDYFIVDVNNAQLAEIARMFEKKQLTIPVGSVLPLSEARARDDGWRPLPFGRQNCSCSRRLIPRRKGSPLPNT